MNYMREYNGIEKREQEILTQYIKMLSAKKKQKPVFHLTPLNAKEIKERLLW